MTFARPYYAARILGSPDVPVPVRNDSGRVVLDVARWPHVEANLSLGVSDTAILDDLDPRQSRRIVLDVYAGSHVDPTYSPWVEKRRNRVPSPRPSAYAGSGWSTTGQVSIPESGWVGMTTTVATTPFIFTATSTRAYAAGEKVTLSLRYRVTAVDGATLRFINVAPHIRTGNIYYRSAGSTRPVVVDQNEDVLIQWVTPTAIAAGAGLELAVVTTTSNGVGLQSVGVGFSMRATEARIEDGWTDSEFFDGSTPSTDPLARYRWTGTVGASESVAESRTQTGWTQVPDGAPRSFNLGIRDVNPSREDSTVSVQLASDEALLGDLAQLADDKTPRTHQGSLRAVVNYVLGKIGASLQPGTLDADVTAYWQVVNQITNPRLANDAVGWQTGSGASSGARIVMSSPLPAVGTTAYRWTASAGESNVVPVTSRYRVTPGKWYVFYAYICSTTARQARAAIQWWSAGGSVASSTALGALVNSDVTAFRQVAVIAKCPPGAEEAVPYVSTLANAAGNQHYATMSMLYEGDELVPYFDGATADSATYDYEFQAAPHNSTSTRTPTTERPPAALTWRAGVSGLDFLSPLVQASGLRLVCNEKREWTLRDDSYRQAGSQAFREAVNIIKADERLSRSAEDWYDGAVFAYTWTDDDGIEQSMTDAYALPGATKVIRREIRAPYPGPGRAQYAVSRAQGKGRTITATKPADWTEAAEQPFSAQLEDAPIQIGTANRVEFDISDNTVTTTSRTTDTPAGAIVLLPGTINALTGTINNL